MPGLTCLRCGSTAVEVIRVIQVAENMHTADARCVACREQSILPLPPPVDD
jgi:hypothetical protein